MTTPSDYPSSLVASLWGGVRDDIQHNVVDIDTAALMSSQDAATSAERRRRELAASTPGLGILLPLEQPPNACAVGIADNDMPVVGEGYAIAAPAAPAQVVVPRGVPVYGSRPGYAAGEVGGVDFVGGMSEAAVGMYLGQRRAAGAVPVLSAPPGPSLWSRRTGRWRNRR